MGVRNNVDARWMNRQNFVSPMGKTNQWEIALGNVMGCRAQVALLGNCRVSTNDDWCDIIAIHIIGQARMFSHLQIPRCVNSRAGIDHRAWRHLCTKAPQKKTLLFSPLFC